MKKTPQEMIEILENLISLEGQSHDDIERFTEDLFYYQSLTK